MVILAIMQSAILPPSAIKVHKFLLLNSNSFDNNDNDDEWFSLIN